MCQPAGADHQSMTRSFTRTAVVALALTLPLLSACSGSNDDGATPADSATATAQASAAAAQHAGEVKFVKEYRKASTKLSKGRTDAQITAYAVLVCGYLADPDVKHNDMINKMSTAMTNNGVRPNDEAVKKVAQSAVKDVCPARKGDLSRVF
jgi:hypothetical protein